MKKHNVPQTTNLRDAVFAYFSVCCNALAKKPACVRPVGGKDSDEAKVNGLGSWRCGNCNKPCSVQRVAKAKVTPVQANA